MSTINENFVVPFANSARQLAQSTLKINSLAFEGLDRIVKLQLESANAGFKSSLDFFNEVTEVSGLDDAKAIWPKSVALVKNTSEQLYAASQDVLGEALKTSEAIGQLFRAEFESANENLNQVASKVAKATKSSKAA